MNLKLHNSLTGKEEEFKPIEDGKVTMYVCGPTVYDRPHLGNARAVVVYDVLFRILRKIYGTENVTYARNITDVDDKINVAAKANGESIQSLTKRITDLFHADMDALNNLRPNIEPKATENIDAIIEMIKKIMASGCAYEAEGHVLFDVSAFRNLGDDEEEPMCCSDPHHHHDDIDEQYFYGKLSGKRVEDNIAGARVEVESYKKNPEDFVLWKPADAEDDESSKFASPWGTGRPGWHIECSAMSTRFLGKNFDIHGGGADLKFPHHENEIAQSLSANRFSGYAKTWVHNGFLTVNGEKMSKSLGNFTTVKDLLDKGVHGETIRLALLSAHYRKPLDFNDKLIDDSKKTLDKFYKNKELVNSNQELDEDLLGKFFDALNDDMNFPLAISILHKAKSAEFLFMCEVLGICGERPQEWVRFHSKSYHQQLVDSLTIAERIDARNQAKANKDFTTADKIRDELLAKGIKLIDSKDSNGNIQTDWEVV